MTDRKAGVIVYTKYQGEYLILVANESKYLSDNVEEVKLNETVPNNEGKEFATNYFTKKAREFSEHIFFSQYRKNDIIKYDQIIEDNGFYKINFRYLPDNSRIGIPKGGYIASDGMSYRNTAIRELREECGDFFGNYASERMSENCFTVVQIERGRGKISKIDEFVIYLLEISSADFNEALSNIDLQNQLFSGELYNLQFKHIKDVLYSRTVNQPTYFALTEFKNRIKTDKDKPFELITAPVPDQTTQLQQPTPGTKSYYDKIQEGGYYQKYLKYKNKYLELKKQLSV
jgi:hypothetical protein